MIFLLNYRRRILVSGLWGLLLCSGFWRLFVYSNTPGEAAQASQVFPVESRLARESNRPTLLIFGHPKCPCSVASVAELEKLMPSIQGKMKSYVVFVKPSGKSEDWAKEDLWKQAQAIPNVQVVLDDGGVEAARFGAKTSGQTFLYDGNGKLVFHGGITASRGHMGDNRGIDAIRSFVETGNAAIAKTPVFGCSLNNPERAPAGRSGNL